MNKKLRVILVVLLNLEKRFPETTEFIEQNMKEVCEIEHIKVKDVIYFAFLLNDGCVHLMFAEGSRSVVVYIFVPYLFYKAVK